MITITAKPMARAVLQTLHRTLPERAFSAFYRFAFARYKALNRASYGLQSVTTKDRAMRDAIYRVLPYTLVGRKGLEVTYKLVRRVIDENIPGHFIELGVARGGCAALIGSAAFSNEPHTDRTLWLFDSFEGLPDTTEDDFVDGRTGPHIQPLVKGSCLGTLAEVQNLMLSEFSFPSESVQFVKGWFQDTLPEWKARIGKLSILRIDGDWYESTKCCLEHLYPQVSSGGFVIVDDYGSCYGCKKAVDEYLSLCGLHPIIHHDGRGGCYFVKP